MYFTLKCLYSVTLHYDLVLSYNVFLCYNFDEVLFAGSLVIKSKSIWVRKERHVT